MNVILTILVIFMFFSCGSGPNQSTVGYLGLTLKQTQEFDPNVDHGKIDNFRIIITTEDSESEMVKYYSGTSESVQIDGFKSGSNLAITVEAINENGFTIRRGYANNIKISAGQISETEVSINNVPIFTNIKPDGYLNLSRFVPRVYAPGEILFQLTDTFENMTTSLSDQINDTVTMSISSDVPESVAPVFVSKLDVGQHTLMVKDPDSGESTEIEFNGYAPVSTQGLVTSSGAFLGLILNQTRQSQIEGRIF